MGLITGIDFFRDGVNVTKTPSATTTQYGLIGFGSSQNYVIRYKLCPEEQINYFRFSYGRHGDISIAHNGQTDRNNVRYYFDNGYFNFYYAITSDSEAYKNANYKDIERAYGKVEVKYGPKREDLEEKSTFVFTCDVNFVLQQGKTYYLWIFPGFCNISGTPDAYRVYGQLWWGDNFGSDGVDLFAGNKFRALIKTSAGVRVYQPVIRNGSTNIKCAPYIST